MINKPPLLRLICKVQSQQVFARLAALLMLNNLNLSIWNMTSCSPKYLKSIRNWVLESQGGAPFSFQANNEADGCRTLQTHPFYTLHVLSSHITSVAGISFLWTILQQWVTFSGLSGHHLKIDTYHDADFLNHLGHDLELLQLHWNTRLRDTLTWPPWETR